MVTFFVDSNFFLQCRDPAELPWGDLARDKNVLVLVPRAVQRELDRLKQSGNSRRARRARRVSSLFRQIIESAEQELVLRDAGPRVAVSFPPPLDPNRNRPASLDLAQADDRIVEEVLAYTALHPKEDVRLLTHDTNAMLTAKQCRLPYVAIPDCWLLPPEPDDRDREIAEIRKRLDVLERDYPKIEVEIQDEAGAALSQVQMNIAVFDDLTPETIDRLAEEARVRHPMAERFEGDGSSNRHHHSTTNLGSLYYLGSRYEPPTPEEIRQYRDVDYPKWIEDVRNFLKNLPGELESPKRYTKVTFSLTNEGTRPAENVVVEFQARGGLLFAPPRAKDNKQDGRDDSRRVICPRPPRPPAGRYVSLASALRGFTEFSTGRTAADVLAGIRPIERPDKDRHAFYWKPRRPIGFEDSWTVTCEEFRHKVEPELFEVVIFVPRTVTAKSVAVICRTTAKNLPEPLVMTLPVKIDYAIGDTLAEAHRLVATMAR